MVFLSNNYQEGIMLALIVDECDELRMWLSVLLATVGYSVQNAKNSLDALTILKNQKTHFDLLLTDFYIPIMTGEELIEESIKNKIEIKKIVILSGHNQNDLKISDLLARYPNVEFMNKLAGIQNLLKTISE
jgi:CheY-like chemotaxis protein